MKIIPSTKYRHIGRIAGSVLLGLLAVACADPGRHADYRRNHTLEVGKTMVSLTINIPFDGRPLSIEDSSNLRGFINDYVNRGRTAVTVEMNTDGSDPYASQKARVAVDLLIRAGLRSNEISVRNAGYDIPGDGTAILSFTANSVKVPECGDWSTDNDYNWSNRNSGNYGCSYQRNLGLNVANPGDLKKARQQSGRDPSRSDAVISGYRAGTFSTNGTSSTGTTATGTSSTSGTTTP